MKYSLFVFLTFLTPLMAEAKITYLKGRAFVVEGLRTSPAEISQSLKEGVTFKLESGSEATLQFEDQTTTRLMGPATMSLSFEEKDSGTARQIQLIAGNIWCSVKKLIQGDSFEVKTPTATAGVRGTEFGVDFEPIEKLMKTHVGEGAVDVMNQVGETLRMTEGMISTVMDDTMKMVEDQLKAVAKWRDFAAIPLDPSREALEETEKLMKNLDSQMQKLQKDLDQMNQNFQKFGDDMQKWGENLHKTQNMENLGEDIEKQVQDSLKNLPGMGAGDWDLFGDED